MTVINVNNVSVLQENYKCLHESQMWTVAYIELIPNVNKCSATWQFQQANTYNFTTGKYTAKRLHDRQTLLKKRKMYLRTFYIPRSRSNYLNILKEQNGLRRMPWCVESLDALLYVFYIVLQYTVSFLFRNAIIMYTYTSRQQLSVLLYCTNNIILVNKRLLVNLYDIGRNEWYKKALS